VVEERHAELEPHRIVFHLIELAGAFHRFYNRHRVIGVDPALRAARLYLAGAVQRVLQIGLGCSACARRKRCDEGAMAERRSPGSRFGQLITLTFGFLLASVVIFVFGCGSGAISPSSRSRSSATWRACRSPRRARTDRWPPPSSDAAVRATPRAGGRRGCRRPHSGAASTATPVLIVRIAATATRGVAAATADAGGRRLTVQAYATNDMMRAVMLSRTLQAKATPRRPPPSRSAA
jgi:hypothetical protein